MILYTAIVILLISIVFLIVKYIYVHAHILSSKEFRRTAEKKSIRMKMKSTIITCDYCGSTIDISKEKRCPNCGALYGEDKELKNRFKVDEKSVEKMADIAAKDAIIKAHKEGLKTLRQLRIAIIALLGVLAMMVAFFIIDDRSASPEKYRGNEDVSDNTYSEYTLIDSPDVTIIDQDGVTLRLVSVYADIDNEKYDNLYSFRVGFSLVNKRNKPVRVNLKCFGINGRSKSDPYIYISSLFKDNSNVVFYENVFGEYFRSIDEIVIGEWSLHDEDGDIYEKNSMETLKFSDEGYTVITDDKDMGNVIFENNDIRIRSFYQGEETGWYDLWIDNLSDNNYIINTSDLLIDNEIRDTYALYDAGLPAGYTFHDDSFFGLSEEYKNRIPNAKVEISLSFTDYDDPKNDFSTGYITLK